MKKFTILWLGLALLFLAGCNNKGDVSINPEGSVHQTGQGLIPADGKPIIGNTSTTRIDWYRMNLTPGTVYTASISAIWSGHASVSLSRNLYSESRPLATAVSFYNIIPGTLVFRAPTKGTLYLRVIGNYTLSLTTGGAKPAGAPSMTAIAFDQTSITNGQPFTGTVTIANANTISTLRDVSIRNIYGDPTLGVWAGTSTTFNGETWGDTRTPTTTIRPAYVLLSGLYEGAYNYDPDISPYYHVNIYYFQNNLTQYWEETNLVPPALTVYNNSAAPPLACAPTLAATPVFGIDPVVNGQANTITLNPNESVWADVRTYYPDRGPYSTTMDTFGVVAAGGGTLSLFTPPSFNSSGHTETVYAEINMTSTISSCVGHYLPLDPLPYNAIGDNSYPLVPNYIMAQRDPIKKINYRTPTNIPVGKLSILP